MKYKFTCKECPRKCSLVCNTVAIPSYCPYNTLGFETSLKRWKWIKAKKRKKSLSNKCSTRVYGEI